MTKYEQLQAAKRNNQLIDLVLRRTQDLYTGEVCFVADRWVLLRTYNDYGMLDGYVLVKNSGIAYLSATSVDVKRLHGRIALAKRLQLLKGQLYPLPNLNEASLLDQIVQDCIQKQSAVLLVANTGDIFQQAYLQKLTADRLQFAVIDPFNFARVGQLQTINLSKVVALEFGGRQLMQATAFFKNLPEHKAPVLLKKNKFLPKMLEQAKSQLLIIYCGENSNNFFVGQVKNVTATEVLVSLVDSVGCFGGYVLLKIKAIAYVGAIADYLQMMQIYEDEHKQNGDFVQPVLNNHFIADPKNMWASVFAQLAQTKATFRLQIKGQMQTQLAYCLNLTATKVKLAVFTDLPANITQEIVCDFAEIDLVTWGYLNTYFTKCELIG
ncbi:hypothetical protein [Bombilactobacillus thymidiniphilus]|uniref:Uncharacterized protein n=1 Tax=Bombilactobacillus thymidiniphilus TaxID=2923363 RepID=A0ABY4PFD5_9LACO|nr:hypothetical protein [Bombilactobacillus thymidiniphilus]UQS84317.1 hypothetical protein MOO47_03980 [Bombilactobacillus thymidiniphilus]